MEAMALESLVASVWRLEGFLSVTRHPVRVAGGYSDVDVIGVRGDGAIRVGECKARGGALSVNVDDGQSWSSWWDESLLNCAKLWDGHTEWLPKPSDVKVFEFHLVGNVWYADSAAHAAAEARLTAALRPHLPASLRTQARACVTPTVDYVLRAVRVVRQEIVDEDWGKRYGDPLLDAVRELVRYCHPRAKGGGRGHGAAISDQTRSRLNEALFGRPTAE